MFTYTLGNEHTNGDGHTVVHQVSKGWGLESATYFHTKFCKTFLCPQYAETMQP